MSNKRYREEFKIEAVKQVTERDHKLAEVAKRLGQDKEIVLAARRTLLLNILIVLSIYAIFSEYFDYIRYRNSTIHWITTE